MLKGLIKEIVRNGALRALHNKLMISVKRSWDPDAIGHACLLAWIM